MNIGDKVWCAACSEVGVHNEFECHNCTSGDVFTAEDILRGEVERARSADRAGMLGFVLDEYRALVHKPKPKKRKK